MGHTVTRKLSVSFSTAAVFSDTPPEKDAKFNLECIEERRRVEYPATKRCSVSWKSAMGERALLHLVLSPARRAYGDGSPWDKWLRMLDQRWSFLVQSIVLSSS
jgi:hypothetical protein